MRALDAAGRMLRDEIKKTISAPAPVRRAPFVKWGVYFRFRATTPARPEAPPRVVNRYLQKKMRSYRAGPHTVRVFAEAQYSLFLEKGTRTAGKHAFMVPTFDVVKRQLWREFVRVMRG